jgi:hypothetical protein
VETDGTAIALDDADGVHIAFHRASDDLLQHAYWRGCTP